MSSSELQTLKEEVKRGQDKVVELWHTNCQQLLIHDDEMLKKDEEIEILSDKLQKLEIELATIKLERLSPGTSTSVSQSISSSFVGSLPGGVSVSVSGPEGRDQSLLPYPGGVEALGQQHEQKLLQLPYRQYHQEYVWPLRQTPILNQCY